MQNKHQKTLDAARDFYMETYILVLENSVSHTSKVTSGTSNMVVMRMVAVEGAKCFGRHLLYVSGKLKEKI